MRFSFTSRALSASCLESRCSLIRAAPGRTTLFTLEQEQASDRAFVPYLVMGGATLFIGAVAGINAFVAPAIPKEPTQVADQPTAIPFTPPVIIRTATPQPTLTLAPPTPGPTTAGQTTSCTGGYAGRTHSGARTHTADCRASTDRSNGAANARSSSYRDNGCGLFCATAQCSAQRRQHRCESHSLCVGAGCRRQSGIAREPHRGRQILPSGYQLCVQVNAATCRAARNMHKRK